MKAVEELWIWLGKHISNSALMLAVLAVLVAIFTLRGRDAIADVVDDRIQPVRDQVEKVDKKQDRYEEDVHEFAKDIRELYRVSPAIRRSDRLEKPFPDHDAGEP